MLPQQDRLSQRSMPRLQAGVLSLVAGVWVSLACTQTAWAQAKPAESKPAAVALVQSTSLNSTAKPAETPSEPAGFLSSVVNTTTSVAGDVANKTGDLVLNALNLIGVRYRYGGNTPDSGLDCSGFVRYVFNDTFGFLLPRRAAEMSQSGAKVAQTDLKPGDLVFFNTMRRTFSHVGIYVGDNKFVHAPRTGQSIRVDDMRTTYWATRYEGARRVEGIEKMDVKTRLNNAMDAIQKGDSKL